MATQAELIIAKAREFLGVKESPAGSNTVIFNTHYYGTKVNGAAYPWCMAFVWDIFRLAGLSHLFYGGQKTASCTVLLEYGRRSGRLVTSGYKPGDIALYNWSGGKNTSDHTGIITAMIGNQIKAIEGNTAVGNDSNGGCVMERTRGTSMLVGAYRPDYKVGGDNTERYETLNDVPEWGYDTVVRLIAAKAIAVPDNKVIDVSKDMVRAWVIWERYLEKLGIMKLS